LKDFCYLLTFPNLNFIHRAVIAEMRNQSDAGFTLIELMFASLILVTGMLSVMSMILFALSANYLSKVEAAALHLSQKKMEELKTLPFDDSRLTGPGNPLDSKFSIDFETSLDPSYSSSTELTLNRARNTKIYFETRWNVTTVGAHKTITVATQNTAGTPLRFNPVNLRVVKAP
jgi:Tfp pilus assembly protein PilV